MKQNLSNEAETMAKTLYGEARGESVAGIEAVANVILNRVKFAIQKGSHWWGNSIIEVCKKPFQFSCWNKQDANAPLLEQDLSQDSVYKICYRIAKRAIAGCLKDNTHGATHYHALCCNPKWAHSAVPCAQIGNHLFYAIY
ncbi:MAG: cell wall hydrolase [Alphaproteobacteria bacterium]|nr:cell wall hydrolase [Alphaproteobacteria bacterium]